MINQFSRTELLIGGEALRRLTSAKVAIFGLGGVGSFAAEALARSGVGSFVLIDNDEVSITNINRQLIATHKTIGRLKTHVMADRIMEINPAALVQTYPCFYSEENANEFDLQEYDYIIDAIDTVTSKILLILKSKQAGSSIISCMGAGNKLNPALFEVADIYSTSSCPLAKVMRRELRQRGIEELKVVYSKETPIKPEKSEEAFSLGKQVPGSIAFVPSVAGLIMAGEAVRELSGEIKEGL